MHDRAEVEDGGGGHKYGVRIGGARYTRSSLFAYSAQRFRVTFRPYESAINVHINAPE